MHPNESGHQRGGRQLYHKPCGTHAALVLDGGNNKFAVQQLTQFTEMKCHPARSKSKRGSSLTGCQAMKRAPTRSRAPSTENHLAIAIAHRRCFLAGLTLPRAPVGRASAAPCCSLLLSPSHRLPVAALSYSSLCLGPCCLSIMA